jgi:hypothetical protein
MNSALGCLPLLDEHLAALEAPLDDAVGHRWPAPFRQHRNRARGGSDREFDSIAMGLPPASWFCKGSS